jgi:hypothetical protein
MRAVKLSLSLPALFLATLSLCACNTVANRRSLYSPKKGDGYWTRSLHDGTWKDRGTKSVETTVTRTRTQAPATQTIPPPPAPPSAPLPESTPQGTPPPAL